MSEGTRYAHVTVGTRESPIKVLFEVTDLEPAIRVTRSGEIARTSEVGDRPRESRTVEIARGESVTKGFHLEDICSSVSEVAGSVMRSLKALETKRTVLEFGVEIAADTGVLTALIVKGSGKANLKITAEW
jgi:hypothetical protein